MELGISICCCICNKFSTKVIEIILIVSYSISILSLFIFIGIIKISSLISIYNLFLILFSLILLIICLIFSIFFRLWRSNGSIKTTKKNISINMAIAGIILILTCFFSCIINEYLLLNEFQKIYNFPCNVNNRNNCIDFNSKQTINKRLLNKINCSYKKIIEFTKVIIYSFFSCVELVSILGIFLFSIIKDRIAFKSEKPNPKNNNCQEISYEPKYDDVGNHIPQNVIIYQQRFSCHGQVNVKNGSQNINNNNHHQNKIINNSQIKDSNIIDHNLNNNFSPLIKGNYSSHQIINSQQTQFNNSQSLINFTKLNSNKQIVHNFGKQKMNQVQASSSERKI